MNITDREMVEAIVLEHINRKIQKELDGKANREELDFLNEEKVQVLAKIQARMRGDKERWTYEKSNPSSGLQ